MSAIDNDIGKKFTQSDKGNTGIRIKPNRFEEHGARYVPITPTST